MIEIYMDMPKNCDECCFEYYNDASDDHRCGARGDEWECQFCCARCMELYGECPNEDCDPMDL